MDFLPASNYHISKLTTKKNAHSLHFLSSIISVTVWLGKANVRTVQAENNFDDSMGLVFRNSIISRNQRPNVVQRGRTWSTTDLLSLTFCQTVQARMKAHQSKAAN